MNMQFSPTSNGQPGVQMFNPVTPVNIPVPNLMQTYMHAALLNRLFGGGQQAGQQQFGQSSPAGQPSGNNMPGFNPSWLQALAGGGLNQGNLNTGANSWNNALATLFGAGANNGGNGAGGNPYGNVWGAQGLWGSR